VFPEEIYPESPGDVGSLCVPLPDSTASSVPQPIRSTAANRSHHSHADNNNNNNNASIGSEYLFAHIAVETLGPMNMSARQLFANLERKISSGDDREKAGLFQSFGAGAALQRSSIRLGESEQRTFPANNLPGEMLWF